MKNKKVKFGIYNKMLLYINGVWYNDYNNVLIL